MFTLRAKLEGFKIITEEGVVIPSLFYIKKPGVWFVNCIGSEKGVIVTSQMVKVENP